MIEKLPKIWCDFNAAGPGTPEDNDFFYRIFKAHVPKSPLQSGSKVLLYSEDGDTEWLTCEAIFDKYKGSIDAFKDCWIARPIDGTWKNIAIADLDIQNE